MNKNCVVTGAGSGVGRAVVLKLAHEGWRIALLGRRLEALQETVQLVGKNATNLKPYACDVGNEAEAADTCRRILAEFGTVDVLVNSAGTNVPRRSLEELSPADYHAMIDANLHGPYYLVQAFLPHMRKRGEGTIINIVSDAGKLASPKAGPGYVMSKFGLAGLTQSINAEERGRGIRACAIFPGDIDTPLLNKRPAPPDETARSRMMQAEDIADCVLFCIQLPSRVIVEEMLVRPR
jgi:NAD(P)-dependent dehydrogenase (short-subunit alcohol dehydrogenase family)